jgi:hypothetical protein
MTDKSAIEAQIQEILHTESDALALSNKLFSPRGLFNQLAEDQAERELIVQTPLFEEAQRRLAHLRRCEAAQFSRNVDDSDHATRLHKVEGV